MHLQSARVVPCIVQNDAMLERVAVAARLGVAWKPEVYVSVVSAAALRSVVGARVSTRHQ
jgi:hypothetical protein